MLDIVAQTTQASDLIREVHGFYDDAWSKLLWAMVALAAVMILLFGVLVPWWLERSRKASFQIAKREILAQIDLKTRQVLSQTQTELEHTRKSYEARLEKLLEHARATELELKRRIARAQADAIWGQGAVMAEVMSSPATVMACYANAVLLYLAAGVSTKDLVRPVREMVDYFSEHFEEIRRSETISLIRTVINQIEKNDSHGDCFIGIDRLKELLLRAGRTGSPSR